MGPETISYVVHTDSMGISDLRLQVSQEASSSKQPLRPVYFRERVLTQDNEIVDNIIDANTERTCWSIHRPTRGWYLYLRSPVLPQGTAISIRSGPKDDTDPAGSPLTFSVSTKVRTQALEQVRPRIVPNVAKPTQQASQATSDTSTSDDDPSRGSAAQFHDAATQNGMQDVAVAVTGRDRGTTASAGHARRRSGATGSGTHAHISKPSLSAAPRSPMIPETDDEDPPEGRKQGSLSRLAIPSNTNSSSSSPHSPGGDRPYSPTLPSNTAFSTTPSAAYTSTFLLTNGRAPQQPAATQSWARWAYCLLPSELRPSLSLDTDKSFSLFWLHPPSVNAEAREDVEVVRFEDQSGRWMWNSHTRGKLMLQTSAMQAVGLQKEFWISVALAYIQFLEDKDAYDAARDA
ncbi:hypothetical protein PSEUBRA_000100 [Kalmanozyma brasiliensis GHG001]|uniref:uncharacterized protein n=1 Tax=Kalmanozyma brasiliensis (strain GHG001) TaxID=1365824 RepID=UPI002867C2B3|nr:uncharacterized protein PSEUBRA_000100 [Kalmanozyma brasiliensis GHG001]KAF6766774.1 hypothetical protein PSEUBRA_000100 [Kalmanozyma brasiliensis GHG001]